MTRRLGLRREALAELTAGEMAVVAGASVSPSCYDCTRYNCPTLDGNCLSIDRCPSIPIRDCPIQ